MLRNKLENRTLKENLLLASSSAFVAGAVNVAGLIAFFAFSSNITGHVANLAMNIAELDKEDIISLTIWLFSFFSGAFIASFVINSFQEASTYKAHAIPIIIEIVILLVIAFYGDIFYKGNHLVSEMLVAGLLFSMGMQNGTVSNITNGLIKTSHLTGLITDLGNEVAYYWHPNTPQEAPVRNKIIIRLTIFTLYVTGGMLGAYCFYKFNFKIFYFIPLILAAILVYDLKPILTHRLRKQLSDR